MKITKHAQKKLQLLCTNHPKIVKLFSSETEFINTIVSMLDNSAQTHGFTKVLNIFIKAIIELQEVDFTTKDNFIKQIQQKFSSLLYENFEKQDEEKNYIKTYFDEIKKIYDKNNNFKDKVEFLPENREQFIQSNLKLVISTAKSYMGLGVPFEDLIGAGNVGLCEAFNKFKGERNTIRESILEDISKSYQETWTKEEVYDLLQRYYTYGNILDKLSRKIPKNGFKTNEEFEVWVKKNIKAAVFASVAFMWIRAFILIEINKTSSIIKLPKDALENMPAKTHFISIAEYNMSKDNPEFDIASDDYDIVNENIDCDFKQTYYKGVVNKMLCCLTPRERRIIIKKFGIGLPYSLKINEIAEDEDISPSRCTIAYKEAIQKISSKLTEEEKKEIVHYLHFD